MAKTLVNEDEYIELCNRELKKHHEYKDGMEIIGVPEGGSGSGLSGISARGEGLTGAIVAQVESRVKEKYELSATPRNEKL